VSLTSRTERAQVRARIEHARSGSLADSLAPVAERLAALDLESSTADDLNAIPGIWVTPDTCDECGATTWNVVEIEPAPYVLVTVCAGCLRAALALLDDGGAVCL
jgi:hypothetical protein